MISQDDSHARIWVNFTKKINYMISYFVEKVIKKRQLWRRGDTEMNRVDSYLRLIVKVQDI